MNLIATLSLAVFLPLAVSAQTDFPYTNASTWDNLVPGTIVYGELLEAPDAIWDDSACTDETRKVDNTLLYPASTAVKQRHSILDREANLHLRLVNSGCAEILPQMPHQYTGSSNPIFIETRYLRLILPEEFDPLLLAGEELNSPDRLIVINMTDHTVNALYGSRVDGRFMVRSGPTPRGDFRCYQMMVADDMPGINAVPWTCNFGGGFKNHGAPWWTWDEIPRGSGGSHGCINLPGKDWYLLQYGHQQMGVAQWLWRWTNANLNFDPTVQDAAVFQKEIVSDQRWYQAVDSVRVIVVDDLNELYDYPLTNRLGELASAATVQSWDEVINAITAVGDNFLLTHVDELGNQVQEIIPAGISKAQREGRNVDSPYIMLPCDDVNRYDQSAYSGSSRTVGTVCYHLRVERNGSICTPERVDWAYLGKRTLCDGPRFDASTLEIRGELIEHENVHLSQFSGYFGDLVRQGLAADDLSPGGLDWSQQSLIGITELMAQMQNVGSVLDEDYTFVLVGPDNNGQPMLVNNEATTTEAWTHVKRECGDPTGLDPQLDRLLTQALFGNAAAYQELEPQCSLPLHQLVPDRGR